MDRLLEVGCDGIEIANRDDIISQKFNSLYSNCFFRSCGTDTHYYGEHSHSDIGKFNIDVNHQNAVKRLLELEKAKNLQTKTKRQKQLANIENQNTFIDFEK